MVVLGAGPAGLAAAWHAAQAGHAVTVLERAPVPGGAAGSFVVGGQRVDHGSHRLHPSTDPAVLADLRRLLGDELQLRRRNGRIRLSGRWIAFPLRPADLLTSLPPAFAAGAALDTLTAPLRRPRADTFAEVVRAGLGPTMAKRFYGPYARKIWGADPAELAGEQARRRISADSPARLLRRLLPKHGEARGVFYYPRTGFGAISERLANAAAAAGADLRYETPAAAVELRNDGATVTAADGTVFSGARVWSTLPLTVLSRLVHPEVAPAVSRAAASLRYRSLLLVYLVLDVGRYTAYDAHYLPESGTPVTRLSEPKNYRDGDDPPERTVLCAEIPCDAGDSLWQGDTPALSALVVGGLRDVGLPPARPVDTVVRRLAFAYPIYHRGYETSLAALDDWAARQPRLLTFGRQGLFAHDNTHHALAMGRAAAAALRPGGGFDAAAWAAARRRFATHVVED